MNKQNVQNKIVICKTYNTLKKKRERFKIILVP